MDNARKGSIENAKVLRGLLKAKTWACPIHHFFCVRFGCSTDVFDLAMYDGWFAGSTSVEVRKIPLPLEYSYY